MSFTDTYLTYRQHLGEVRQYREDRRKDEAVRQSAFKDKVLTPEELSLAKKRGELLKRTIDALDERAQTKTEDVESVTQTVLGESTTLLTATGVGLGKLYQSTESGKALTQSIAKKMGKLSSAAKNVIPGATGLAFAILSSLPLLASLVTIEIQTPRVARFETMKGELSDIHDYAILSDEQIKEAKQKAKNIDVPPPKPTNKGLLASLNIYGQAKSYMDIVAKRAIYAKDKADFEIKDKKKHQNAKNLKFSPQELEKADETKEILQRLVRRIDLEAQDYNENAFKILDVIGSCIFGFGIIGYWGIEKAMKLLKIKDGAFKKYFPAASAIAGVILVNSKIAEYRNNAIRISRHKQMKELMKDPTNFLKTPKTNKTTKDVKVEPYKKQSMLGFVKDFYSDLKEYKTYAKEDMKENRKMREAVKTLKLSPSQIEEAKLNRMNVFKMIHTVDENKKKYEENIDILATVIATPMGLVAATMGNAFGWAMYKLKDAPKSKMPLYSILGTAVGLIPAIGVELFTTIEARKASRVGYMQAHKELADRNTYLDYSKVRVEENNPFLKMSFNSLEKFNQVKQS